MARSTWRLGPEGADLGQRGGACSAERARKVRCMRPSVSLLRPRGACSGAKSWVEEAQAPERRGVTTAMQRRDEPRPGDVIARTSSASSGRAPSVDVQISRRELGPRLFHAAALASASRLWTAFFEERVSQKTSRNGEAARADPKSAGAGQNEGLASASRLLWRKASTCAANAASAAATRRACASPAMASALNTQSPTAGMAAHNSTCTRGSPTDPRRVPPVGGGRRGLQQVLNGLTEPRGMLHGRDAGLGWPRTVDASRNGKRPGSRGAARHERYKQRSTRGRQRSRTSFRAAPCWRGVRSHALAVAQADYRTSRSPVATYSAGGGSSVARWPSRLTALLGQQVWWRTAPAPPACRRRLVSARRGRLHAVMGESAADRAHLQSRAHRTLPRGRRCRGVLARCDRYEKRLPATIQGPVAG